MTATATQLIITNNFSDLVTKFNIVSSDLGATDSLTTTAKNTIVASINELDALQGNITLGTDASTVTGAIAEIETALRGSTANYTLTTNATDFLGGINELELGLRGTSNNLVATDLSMFTANNVVSALIELDVDIHGSGGGSAASDLDTSATDLVGAINEIEGVFDASAFGISAGSNAFDVTSGAFTIDASGTITLDAATTALTGDLTLVDGEKIKLGTGADLQIYHDGNNSIIDETGTGNLFVRATNVNIQNVDADPDENMAVFNAGGSVDLYHDNVKKFETTANGIVVTGSTIANGIVSITDNNSDISPDGTGSGHLRIDGNGYKAAIALDADGVNLYSTSAKPLIFGVNETEVSRVTTTGMNVTGTLNVSGGADVTGTLDLSSHLDMPDDAQIKLGDDDDFILQHEAGGITEILAQQLRIKNLAATETLASFNADGSTNLFYNGEGRLGTSNTGVAILNNKNLELGSPASITSGGNTAITFAGANITMSGTITPSISLDTSATTVAASINELHTDIGTNTSNISTNTSNISTNTSNISSNDTDISTINTKLGTITTGVMLTSASNVGAAIGELHGDIGTNTSSINTINTKLGTITTGVMLTSASNVGAAIGELHGDIGTNTTAIGLNTTARTNNASAIGTLGGLDSDISADGNLVAAINELQGDIRQINANGATANNTIIGTLAQLNTDAQNNIVAAINEIEGVFDASDKGISAGTDAFNVVSGAFGINASGAITLDATGDIVLKDAGVVFSTLENSGGNLILKSGTTTALTFSGADVTMGGDIIIAGDVDGRDVSVDGAKLDLIEDNATADQTAAEIRTLVESATNSNVFTDADHSKLNGIETSATADQTAAQILTKVKTVDGASSGLDADLLDGQHGSHYGTASAVSTNTTAIGTLSTLTTTEKSNLVGALNELKLRLPLVYNASGTLLN
jgi:hypothetical protein